MMKQITLILILFYTTLYADINVTVSIHGDLDDDLFVIKSDFESIAFEDCLQMHNPQKYFLYDGEMVLSQKIYGMVDFNKTYKLSDDEVLLVMTANEREEINPKRALLKRTHFKSVNLFVDDKVLIPSLMPETDDVPTYPLWFGKDEKPMVAQKDGYNYYKLWENSIVNLGLVFVSHGRYTLYFIDREDEVVFTKKIMVTKEMKNIKLLASHTLTEVDGSVYDGIKSADTIIKKKAIEGVVIQKEGKRIFVKLPYPFVYVNRIFVKGV